MKGKKAIQSKFPTARIKKIMQEDEEIGKVAAGAPIVISRALELFLKDIVLESAVIAREQGAKKVMPYHIKRLSTTNRTYDFLDDMLAKYADPTAGVVTNTNGLGAVEVNDTATSQGNGKARAPASSEQRKSSEDDEDEDVAEEEESG